MPYPLASVNILDILPKTGFNARPTLTRAGGSTMKQIWCLALLASMMAGCQSPIVTKTEAEWPSKSVMAQHEVHSFNVINTKKKDIPFLLPITNRGDLRFKHEAVATYKGVDKSKFPVFSMPKGKVGLQLNIEESGETKLGVLPVRYTILFQFNQGAKKSIDDRGSISVDQVGFSIWQPSHEKGWAKVKRKDHQDRWDKARAPTP